MEWNEMDLTSIFNIHVVVHCSVQSSDVKRNETQTQHLIKLSLAACHAISLEFRRIYFIEISNAEIYPGNKKFNKIRSIH